MDYFRIAENPGTILPCDLGTRCLTATTRKDLRMASLPHGVEEPGDVQDIRLVVDTIPTLAWSAGPDGSADFFNQRWLEYTGLSAKQALGSGWEVAIHPDDLPRILERLHRAGRGADAKRHRSLARWPEWNDRTSSRLAAHRTAIRTRSERNAVFRIRILRQATWPGSFS